jgi:hypothetical protein
MLDEDPDLFATLMNESTGEIVYLLAIPTENQAILIQMSAGVEKQLKAGAEFEIREFADTTVQDLLQNGWKEQEEGFTFDTLHSTRAVALRLGYRFINDQKHFQTHTNFFGRTSLAEWPGATGADDSSWEYALSHAKITGRPKLQFRVPEKKMNAQEFFSALRPAIEKQRAMGGEQSFSLARN